MKLQGIFLPVTIPFDHTGSIYEVKVQHNVEKWNRTSLSGFVVCGEEGAYLSSDENVRMWEWVAEYSAPEKVLIAAVGKPSVHETVALANRAESLGYKAAIVRVPSAPAETQAVYFRSIADQSKIPIIIDGDFAQLESVVEQHPNIIAAVASKPSPKQFLTDSHVVADAFAAGATAAILLLANAIPYAAISIWEAHRTRDFEAARDWQNRIAPAAQMLEKYGLAALKHAMDLNGYYGGPPRLPLTMLTPAARKEVEQAFAGIKG